jgi:hypothetical protein
MFHQVVPALLAATLFLASSDMTLAAEPAAASFVAGLAPHQRPQGAPTIREFVQDSSWRTRALTGVVTPVPASLAFLDNQGAWYTPFNRPGMPGYYDLRQWHDGAAQATVKPVR